MSRLTPDPEQQEAIERMVNEPTKAALVGSQYGTGKTLVAVETALGLKAEVILVAVPLFTKYSWKATILRQHPEAEVKFVNSLKAGRQALADLLEGKPGWYIIGREYLRSKRVFEAIAPRSSLIDILIYDECQSWANRKSIGFRQMKKIKPKYRMAMSATPYGNKFDGLYAITKWLWPDLVPNSYWNWVAEWCQTENDYFSGTVILGEKEPGQYVNQLPCYIRLEKDFGDPINTVMQIELSAKERKIYDALEKRLVVWLKENPLIVKFPHTKRMRLRQMTLGEVSVDPDTDEVYFDKDMKSTKYETLVGILREADEPALILTDSQKFASVVTYKLIEDGFKALEWSGRIPEDIRHAVKNAFVEGDIDYIVATIPSIGEGVDGLQHRARLMVWLSRSDNNMLNEQAFRRLYRRGQEHQVVSIDIQAIDTYDEGQLSTLIQQTLNLNRTLKKEGGL